jgi:hypothetical protein
MAVRKQIKPEHVGDAVHQDRTGECVPLNQGVMW